MSRPPPFTTMMSASGAMPVNFPNWARPFPAAVPVTCVPWPLMSFSRTTPGGEAPSSALICACVYSTPYANPEGDDSPETGESVWSQIERMRDFVESVGDLKSLCFQSIPVS